MSYKITRKNEAYTYEAPGHFDVRTTRLHDPKDVNQGGITMGLSHFLPGGGAGPDASPLEKVYVILSGEMTVIVDGKETVLNVMDSCTIPGGEVREIINRGNNVCSMLVVMPYPPKA